MRCNQCGDQIVGKPGYESTSVKSGWCGSPTRRKHTVVCQDCTGAGEYQQHLARLAHAAELEAAFERKFGVKA